MLPVQIYGTIQLADDERRRNIHHFNIERRIMRNDSDPFALRDVQFIELFRLTKEMVNYLFETLIPHMSMSVHPSEIEPRLRIFAALYFYGTGSYQRTVGQSLHISMAQNSVSNCVKEITDLIVEQLSEEWIVFPTMFEAKLSVKRKFIEKYHFPGCIGAIDCTHVAMIAPPEEEHNYLNRKRYHSKNVQIVCDPDLKILNVNARWGGASHDAFIWRHSNIRNYLEENFGNREQTWIIGDSGYPQEPWLMTPVMNAAPGSPQERCILGERVLRYGPVQCGQIITATAVLHNICTNARLPFEQPQPDLNNHGDGVVDCANEVPNLTGRDVRNNLIERYFT